MTRARAPAEPQERISDSCPCGRVLAYAHCCGRYHAGQPAPDAESLMRSRYCAYVLRMEDYLLATWHAPKRPAVLGLGTAPQPRWLGLQVMAHAQTGGTATVEFVARCKLGGRVERIHEISRFVFEDGRWYYVDGVLEGTD